MAFNRDDIRTLYRSELAEKSERAREPFAATKAERQKARDLRKGKPKPATYSTKGATKR